MKNRPFKTSSHRRFGAHKSTERPTPALRFNLAKHTNNATENGVKVTLCLFAHCEVLLTSRQYPNPDAVLQSHRTKRTERRSSIANGLGQLQVICFTYGADRKGSVENYLTFMAKIIVPISVSYGIHSFDPGVQEGMQNLINLTETIDRYYVTQQELFYFEN